MSTVNTGLKSASVSTSITTMSNTKIYIKKINKNNYNKNNYKLSSNNNLLSSNGDPVGLSLDKNCLSSFCHGDKEKKNAFFIEGGGTRGVYAIGILRYLFDDNKYFNLSQVDIFGGTSVGSYFATALSLGFDKNDIADLSKIINLNSLTDGDYMFAKTFYRFVTKNYMYDDIGRTDIIKKILDQKFNNIKQHLEKNIDNTVASIDLTFGHLQILIKLYPKIYKHLVMNAVDLSTSKQIFMTTLDNKFTNIKIYDALLASSSIPFVFKPVILYYDPLLDTYSYTYSTNFTENTLVDGAVSTGNPLDYFLLKDKIINDYELWLLKFTHEPIYTKINSTYSLFKQLVEYLISGKNEIKTKLIEDLYPINIINLYSTNGVLDIYTPQQVQEISIDIYQKCINGDLYFNN